MRSASGGRGTLSAAVETLPPWPHWRGRPVVVTTGAESATEWASTLVAQQQQLGAHVTTLTDAYDSLSENVNRMIDASNSVTSELETLSR